MKPELVQKELYDRIASDYEAHYDDEASQRFRDTFIYPHLLGRIDFKGTRVLEAMCGSGQVTRQLLARGAQVVGLDVSQSQVQLFKAKFPECDAVCASVTDLSFEPDSFDHVVVMGRLSQDSGLTTRAAARVAFVDVFTISETGMLHACRRYYFSPPA